MMTGTYRFVRHREVQSFLERGWTIASDLSGTPHGHWSVLMKEPE